MGSPQSELSLDFKPTDKSLRLEEFLARLEEERLKIEAFKRELPLCMKLLTNAMETYKQQLETYHTSNNTNGAKPVLEEYIPLKSLPINGDHQEKPIPTVVSSEKASWMVSAQLWSPAGHETKQQQAPETPKNSINPNSTEVSTNLALDNTKQRHGGGAFIPFTKDNNFKVSSSCVTTSATTTTCSSSSYVIPDLALASHNSKEIENKNLSEVESGSKSGSTAPAPAPAHAPPTNGQNSGTSATGSQTHRKARRCWSPDLHRRFVNALQILGGSQVATPKQIRELMKVEGLTNDEVKSHLQKYRLHTRRPMVAAQPAVSAAPQLVVLGGIWVPPEYATSAAAGPGIYGAHPVPTHYCAPPVAQEFYSPATAAAVAVAQQQQHHHHHHQRQQHVQPLPPRNVGSSYKGKVVVESPESDMRSGGETSESIGEREEEEEEERQEREDEDDEGDADVEVDDKSAAQNALVLVNHGLQETGGLKL